MKRFFSFFVALVLLTATVSCTRTAEHGGGASIAPDIDLTVEEIPVTYTAEEVETFSARITSMVSRMVFLREGLRLDDAQKQKIRNTVVREVLPMFEKRSVSASKLDALCMSAEQLCDAAEQNANGQTPSGDAMLSLLLDCYGQGLALLGSDCAGGILYESLLLWLDHKISVCDERYEKYGYTWYLEDGDSYRAQRTQLTDELGEHAFSSAAEVLFFGLSELSDIGKTQEGTSLDGLVNDAELVLLLQRQAEHLLVQTLTEKQWETACALLHAWVLQELALPTSLTAVQKAELGVLQANGLFAGSVGKTIPETLALYDAFARALTAEDMVSLRSEDEIARLGAICRVLTSCESEFLAFATSFASKVTTDRVAEETALREAGAWESYSAYASEMTSMSASELFLHIRACGEDPNGQTVADLQHAWEAFLFGCLPYLTFALCCSSSAQCAV